MRAPGARTLLLTLVLAATSEAAGQAAATGDLSALAWRSIGPYRGGRASAVAGIGSDPFTYYMGTAGGGVYKTTNAGVTWHNVSDGFLRTGSVGAIAVAPSNPGVIYVGMGEATARANTVHHGDGIYKSTDAGKTWRHVGLAETQVISRIVVDPRDPDLVYVAAQGALYAPTQDRGIYRSSDGGTTWKKVLFAGETAGASDLALEPANPRVLYAAFWDHQRFPWDIRQYGPGSGIHRSSDGGETWQKLSNGLPATMGKLAVATTSTAGRAYALVTTTEAGKSGLYHTTDAGASWSLVSTRAELTRRFWYYTKLFIDPVNPDVVWVPNIPLLKSTDGGRTFVTAPETPHADRHEMWINPSNPRFMAMADDGGASISTDGGLTWSTQMNQATAQVYRIVTDNLFPYRIYGAQQDNSSFVIASASGGGEGIGRADWREVAGYENSFVDVDPDAPDISWGTGILGEVEWRSESTGLSGTVNPSPMLFWGTSPSRHEKYRYVLNVPLFVSRHPARTLYLGAQKLLASDDKGRTWREVSPDVTRRGTEAGRDQRLGTGLTGDGTYGAINYAAESPLRPGVLWTGSDDGMVAVTRDGGKTWHRALLPGADDARINALEASPHDPAVAYVAATRFQFNDYTPFFFRTNDYGRTWTRIGASLPAGGWARVIREDPVRRHMLYAGTELGMHYSRDDGATWHPLQTRLPVTPIYDLRVRGNDLIVATGGRSLWILDNVTPLRQLDAVASARAYLFRPAVAYRTTQGGSSAANEAGAHGANPMRGAVLDFHLAAAGPVRMEIVDAAGATVRTLTFGEAREGGGGGGGAVGGRGGGGGSAAVKAGLNRVAWDLRQTAVPVIPGAGIFGGGTAQGRWALPGRYTVRLIAGGDTMTAPLEVRASPGAKVPATAYAEQERFLRVIEEDLVEYRELSQRMERARTALADSLKSITEPAALQAARARHSALTLDTEIYGLLANLHSKVNAIVPGVEASERDTHAMLRREWQKLKAATEAWLR
jgi:photosystem II stability/assembly factor-like uncharacterized protein